MILGRLIRTMGAQRLSPIPVSWLTRIFVAGDVVSFTVQAAGAGAQAGGTLDLYNLGEKIIIVGLFVQIALFSGFVAVGVTIFFRLRRSLSMSISTPAAVEPTAIAAVVPWRRHLYALFASSTLILVRSIFRVVEYLQGNGGYLVSHEIFLYVFDTLLMVAVMAVFAIWYIDDLMPKNGDGMEMKRKIFRNCPSDTNDDEQQGAALIHQR